MTFIFFLEIDAGVGAGLTLSVGHEGEHEFQVQGERTILFEGLEEGFGPDGVFLSVAEVDVGSESVGIGAVEEDDGAFRSLHAKGFALAFNALKLALAFEVEDDFVAFFESDKFRRLLFVVEDDVAVVALTRNIHSFAGDDEFSVLEFALAEETSLGAIPSRAGKAVLISYDVEILVAASDDLERAVLIGPEVFALDLEGVEILTVFYDLVDVGEFLAESGGGSEGDDGESAEEFFHSEESCKMGGGNMTRRPRRGGAPGTRFTLLKEN